MVSRHEGWVGKPARPAAGRGDLGLGARGHTRAGRNVL